MDRRSRNNTTNDSRTPNKPDKDSKEFLEWKIQRLEKRQNEQVCELSAIIMEQRKEINDLKEKNKAQHLQLVTLQAELKDCKGEYETVQKEYEHMEDLHNKCNITCAGLKHKLFDVQEYYISQIAMLKEQRDKDLDEQKCAYDTKITTMEGQHSRAEARWKSQLNKKTQDIKRTTQEKDDQINKLLNANQALHTQVKQVNSEMENNAKSANLLKKQLQEKIVKLQNMNKDYQNTMEKKRNYETQEIAKLEKQIEAQAKTICERNKYISYLFKDKEQQYKQIQDEKTKCTMMEVHFRTKDEAIRELKEKLAKLEVLQGKTSTNLKMARDESKETKRKMQILQQQLQESKPLHSAEKQKQRALEHENRDLLAGLEGCRNVLQDPGALKKKVATMIAHYLQGDTKVRVDRDVENVNMELVETVRNQHERIDRIVFHHKKEIKQVMAAANSARIRTDDETMLCVTYINDQRMQNAKKDERNPSA